MEITLCIDTEWLHWFFVDTAYGYCIMFLIQFLFWSKYIAKENNKVIEDDDSLGYILVAALAFLIAIFPFSVVLFFCLFKPYAWWLKR